MEELLKRIDENALIEGDIALIEREIVESNISMAKGVERVSDSIYDFLVNTLMELKPNSDVLKEVWSEDINPLEDTDKYLVDHPMLSILTIKDIEDKGVKDFKSTLPKSETIKVVGSIKENGHAFRVVLKDGNILKGTTRGRNTNGKDITKQIRRIIGDKIEGLKDKGLVELRGEILLPIDRLEEARVFNKEIKSAFSGVASMLRDSATVEETQLLTIVVFDIMGDSLLFDTLSSKFEYIKSIGLEAPLYINRSVHKDTLESDLVGIVGDMEVESETYKYYTDGVVVTVDNNELFDSMGVEDKYRKGNLALKIGKWSQDVYEGIIERIEWKEGTNKKTPVAIINGVLTHTGNTVKSVPLYSPKYILMLEAYVGRVIKFKYGGEAGVVPLTKEGIPLRK